MSRQARGPDPRVGLCASCVHAARQRNSRGSVFWRCRRADTDPRLLRYPPLPVTACPGFEPADAPPEEVE